MAIYPYNYLPRWKRRIIFILLFGITVLVGSYILITNQDLKSNQKQQGYKLAGEATEQQRKDESKRQSFVVDTPTCKIPEMDPFDTTIERFLKPDLGYPVDCRSQHRSWMYLNETRLILNITTVRNTGYSTSSIHCCYRAVERVEQPLSDYDMNADNYIKYSDKCHPINFDSNYSSGLIDAEFIRVHCISKSIPLLHDVVYRDFFAFAQPHNDRLVSRKLSDWKSKIHVANAMQSTTGNENRRPPPNVIIIGIDNNSRMNSHRHLKQTLSTLREIGAVELLGYTKVAENTFPNTVPFLSGMNVTELEKHFHGYNLPQDDYPYVWKLFDAAGYITIHAEDSPYLGGFNYLKSGFLRKPTDFYLRPVMLAVMTHMPRSDYYHTDCIGRYMTEEFVFDYIFNLIKLANSHSAPTFVHSWLTSLAHANYNNLQFGDASITKFIQSVIKASHDNTIFFFMSDHGQRYGPIRETTQGWYEDKLPTQWVYLPSHLRTKYPQWYSSLQTNSARLTSHFDVYKTLLQILQEFDESHNYHQIDESLKPPTNSVGGQSLFEIVPESRTCTNAGIAINYCACSTPTPISIDDKVVIAAANFAAKYLSTLVPLDLCAKPELKKIVTAGYLDFPSRPVYLLTFVTDPGDFLFEVNVEFEKSSGSNENKFEINTDILRMNKITRAVTCVSDPILERYCYCK